MYNVGCQLTIVGTNMNDWSAGDTYEYFVISPNVTNVATAIPTAGCNPNPWTGTTGTTCSSASTTLNVQGSYQFLIYDTTQKIWVTSFYANAGQTFDITVYSDPFHTAPQYQFDTGSSGAAYVYLQNVATSGKYVMFVQSNGVNVYCAYMAPAGAAALPAPSPRPTGGASGNNLLCNTSTANVTGVNAPGGNLSLTWALNSALEAGLYTVGIYDQNANGGTGAVLGTVQVSLTSGGAALLTTGQYDRNELVAGAVWPDRYEHIGVELHDRSIRRRYYRDDAASDSGPADDLPLDGHRSRRSSDGHARPSRAELERHAYEHV